LPLHGPQLLLAVLQMASDAGQSPLVTQPPHLLVAMMDGVHAPPPYSAPLL